MRILGIESSCDETGAAVVLDGRTILSNALASQATIHERYGGVVPEVASRQQLVSLIPVVESALAQARLDWDDLDGIAVTYGPGLAGSLLVGLTGGKTFALARSLPFLGINHLEAHIYANWLRTGASDASDTADTAQLSNTPSTPETHTPRDIGADGASEQGDHGDLDQRPGDPVFPLLALVISGAHTELVFIPHHGRYELLGQTRDDAAGEAFDKVARLLGLGYPGGPAIERAAQSAAHGSANPYRMPRAWLPGTHDFSFSGLKTAVLQVMEGAQAGVEPGSSRYAREGAAAASASGGVSIADVAAAFQEAVVDVLATKTVRAARALGVRQVVLAGGVAANLALRERLHADLAPLDVALRYPPVAYCTDNAAMIAAAAYFHMRLGERSGLDLDVRPNLQLPFAARV